MGCLEVENCVLLISLGAVSDHVTEELVLKWVTEQGYQVLALFLQSILNFKVKGIVFNAHDDLMTHFRLDA